MPAAPRRSCARGQSSIRPTPPSVAMCSVPFWPSRCKSISTTSCVKRVPPRNGRNCCAISTGCRMCVSSIAAPIGWCARMRRQTSWPCSVTPISCCRPALGKPRRRRLHHRHRPTNAAVAQSVVPRRLEFRRNSHEIRDCRNQVSSGASPPTDSKKYTENARLRGLF